MFKCIHTGEEPQTKLVNDYKLLARTVALGCFRLRFRKNPILVVTSLEGAIRYYNSGINNFI